MEGGIFLRLHELAPMGGSVKKRKRVGRGMASGLGKTSGKGNKGQNARSGGGVRPGFEGGQMPFQRRVPKRGFNNIFKKRYAILNVSRLNIFEDGAEVNISKLLDLGVVNQEYDGLKILGSGDINKKLKVTAAKFSKSAVKKIEAVGGKVDIG